MTKTSVIDSPTLDYLLMMGVALDQLANAVNANPRVELRVSNGLIGVGLVGEEPVAWFGTRDCDFTASNWQRAAARLASL